MLRFIAGVVAGGLVLYFWGEDLKKLANTKGRAVRTMAVDALKSVQQTADDVLDSAKEQVDSTLEAGQNALRPHRIRVS